MASALGHKIVFWSKIVAVYPDNVVRDLIAHELAHVYQSALGGESEDYDNPLCVEDDADWLMQLWGFDPVAIDDWDREHGLGEIRNVDPDTPAGKRALKRTIRRILKYGQ
jgi:hypothetical protein